MNKNNPALKSSSRHKRPTVLEVPTIARQNHSNYDSSIITLSWGKCIDLDVFSCISDSGTLDPIVFPAEAVQIPSSAVLNGSVVASGYIEYSENGRSDRSPTVTTTSQTTGYTLDFGRTAQGGWIRVHLEVPIRFRNGVTRVDKFDFSGRITGPWGAVPKNIIKNAIGDIPLQVICYKESRFRQFDENCAPLFGPPNGFGAMQLDTPRPSVEQLWNWRANIEGGRNLYQKKIQEVRQHFANIKKAHPEATDLSSEQFSLALYQYYNGGFYWDWNSSLKRWDKVGTTQYGDDCLRIEKLVRAGTPPGDWV